MKIENFMPRIHFEALCNHFEEPLMYIGISYDRWSDPGQSEGDSRNRQDRAFATFCDRHSLQPATLRFIDSGKSGFHGEHLEGKLGELIELAKAGTWPKGTVIVVEAWDRLGRLRPDKQVAKIAELLETGVRIGICRLDDIFCEQDFGTHKWTGLSTFIQLAYQESLQKSERIGHAWAGKKRRTREGKLLTSKVPEWLTVVEGTLQPIPERIAIIKQIFQLAADGYGISRIAKATGWNRSYIDSILRDRRVVGEYQPKKGEGKSRQLDGEPVPNYYPQIISEDEYALAHTGQRVWRGGGRQTKHLNLFSRLLVNAEDGEGFTLMNRSSGGKVSYHLANTGSVKKGLSPTSFPYAVFEQAVLRLLQEVKASELARKPATGSVKVLQARLALIRADLGVLQDALRKAPSTAGAVVLAEKEAELRQVEAELDEARAQELHSAEDSWKEAGSLIDHASTEDGRLKLRGLFRRTIERVTLYIVRRPSIRFCFAQVDFHSGLVRHYDLIYKPPHASHGVRKAGWWMAQTSTGPYADLADPEYRTFLEEFVRDWQEPSEHKSIPGKVIWQELP